MAEITVTVSQSLECDGGSITVRSGDGTRLPIRRVSSRRQYRTEYVTYAVDVDAPCTHAVLTLDNAQQVVAELRKQCGVCDAQAESSQARSDG